MLSLRIKFSSLKFHYVQITPIQIYLQRKVIMRRRRLSQCHGKYCKNYIFRTSRHTTLIQTVKISILKEKQSLLSVLRANVSIKQTAASHPKFVFIPIFIVCSPICSNNCGIVFFIKIYFSFRLCVVCIVSRQNNTNTQGNFYSNFITILWSFKSLKLSRFCLIGHC